MRKRERGNERGERLEERETYGPTKNVGEREAVLTQLMV